MSIPLPNKRFKTTFVHRVVCLLHSGFNSISSLPAVDHIDGNKKNNFAGNLRPAGNSVNNFNKRKRRNTISKYRYVTPAGDKWTASATHKQRAIYIGTFPEEKRAAIAADRYIVDLLGIKGILAEGRQLNFPEMYGIKDNRKGISEIVKQWIPLPSAQLELFPDVTPNVESGETEPVVQLDLFKME